MILGFKRYFDWKEDKQPVPTNFREKILSGVGKIRQEDLSGNVFILNEWPLLPPIIKFKPKIHSMRLDPHDLWKPGMSIQMVYRGPKYSILDHFNKGIPELERCISTQRIEVTFNDRITPVMRPCCIKIDNKIYWEGFVSKSGTSCGSEADRLRIELLATNDGFVDSIQFFRWFKKDFTGKIIHFSDYRY
jgi:hypothetical protein